MSVEAERERRERAWPEVFRDGARCAFLMTFSGDREPGGYPRGFHRWPLDKRNAWLAGFDVGFHGRLRVAAEQSDG